MTNKHPKGPSITSEQGAQDSLKVPHTSEGPAWKRQHGAGKERWGGISTQPTAEAEFAFGPQHGGNPLGIPKLECAMEWLISEKL